MLGNREIIFDAGLIEAYRYGFNGMEKMNDVSLTGATYDFGARMYDARLGRWMSVDALVKKYPAASPYNFVLNTPIQAYDPDGMRVYYVASDGTITRITRSSLKHLNNEVLVKGLELMNLSKMGGGLFNVFANSNKKNVFLMVVDGHLLERDNPDAPDGCNSELGSTLHAFADTWYGWHQELPGFKYMIENNSIIKTHDNSFLDAAISIDKDQGQDWNAAFTLWHEMLHRLIHEDSHQASLIVQNKNHLEMGLIYDENEKEINVRGGLSEKFLIDLTHSIYKELKKAQRQGDVQRTDYLRGQFRSIAKYRLDKKNFVEPGKK